MGVHALDELLLTAAGPRPAQRGPAARIVRPGTRIDLPRPGTQAGTGRYWAIGPTAPLWTPTDLAWLLKDPTPPLPTTSESAP
ncbi:hypothetical protein [Streptomyces californicus]|uniref:hypothetical protein n=1 Tax=Streptomyces californicus TaxID=67351 RepID=UPI0037240E8B